MFQRIKNIRAILVILFILVISLSILLQFDWFWRKIYPLAYKDLIIVNSNKYNLDPSLLAAIIYVESNFSVDACSHKGAMGLMQVMPETGYWIARQLNIEGFSEEQLFDPVLNIKFGAWYLSDLKQEFDDNLIAILAAYNAGRGNVNEWSETWDINYNGLSDFPYPETRDYIRKVLKVYKFYSKLYEFE